jgi:hypothetical protein
VPYSGYLLSPEVSKAILKIFNMKINIEPKKIYKKVAINLFEKANIKVTNKIITLTELQPSTILAMYLEL